MSRFLSLIALTALFTFVHWLLLVFSAGEAVGAGVHRMDHPDAPVSVEERVSRLLLPVLVQPGSSVSDTLRDHGAPYAFYETVELLNSLLWGVTIAIIVYLLTRKKAASANSPHP